MNPLHKFSHKSLWFMLLVVILLGCNQTEEEQADYKQFQKGEFIYRRHHEKQFTILPPKAKAKELYSWEQGQVGSLPKITKEYFRCKGSNLNPVRIVQEKEDLVRYFDCGGVDKHSLPLRNEKEFIYPILLDLMNYIQMKTKKRVVITSGHRCPDHNTYVDPSPTNRFSKHMVGAEVSFYVQGMEEQPEKIVQLLTSYYEKENKKDFEFKRYEKQDVDVSTQPWYNKEIFIKLYKKKEGRNFDNRHPYPYISVQVRYDSETGEKVIYSWDKAFNNYMRH